MRSKQGELPHVFRLSAELKLCSLGQGMIAAFIELTTGNSLLGWFSQQMLGRSIKVGQKKNAIVLLLCVTCKKTLTHWTCSFVPISGPLPYRWWMVLLPRSKSQAGIASYWVPLLVWWGRNLPTAVFCVTAQAGMGAEGWFRTKSLHETFW